MIYNVDMPRHIIITMDRNQTRRHGILLRLSSSIIILITIHTITTNKVEKS
jgi:hypothetical protein